MKDAIQPTTLRPLTARSIVLSVLLGSHPPAMPVAPLLEFTALFGISSGAVRTALSRMVASGDVIRGDGVYRLSGRLQVRQSQQEAGLEITATEWDGDWWFAAVVADRRSIAMRREFRTRIEGARFGELRPDFWLRPANVDAPLDLPNVILTRGPMLTGDSTEIVARLWNLEDLEDQARQHGRQMDEVIDRMGSSHGDETLAPSFTAMAACLRYLRTEPQLPAALAHSSTGDDLRARYDRAVRIFRIELAAFFARRGVSTNGR